MKKNFISILLAVLVLLSSAMFVGCNNASKTPEPWEISKEEWQYVISTEGFTIELHDRGDINNLQDDDLISLSYQHVVGVVGWNNAILLDVVYKDSSSDTLTRELNLVKEMNLDGTFGGYLERSPKTGATNKLILLMSNLIHTLKNI